MRISNISIRVFLQTLMLCFKPLGLQEHQLRPQDVGEKSLADIGADSQEAKYAGGEPFTVQQDKPHTFSVCPFSFFLC